jgi:hypothetical protein
MATDDPDDPSVRTDAAFERWLLGSARSDAPSAGATERAWSQLSQALGAALPVDTPSAARGPAGGPMAGSAAALKWLAIGALGGALVTATWMGEQTHEGSPTPAQQPALVPARTADIEPAPDSEPARGAAPPAASQAELEPVPSLAVESTRAGRRPPAPVVTIPRARRHAELTRGAPRTRSTASPAEVTAAPPHPEAASPSSRASTLEREVALLDAVRSALTQTDFDGALALIAEYRRQFERGELARDADVFEIEAFAGRGERARAARAAQTFLRLYPRDPHAARLRALAERQPE